MELEIKTIPEIGSGRKTDVGMHSLLNHLNVLMGELYVIGIIVADEETYFEEAIGQTKDFIAQLQEKPDPGFLIHELPYFHQHYLYEMKKRMKAVPESADTVELGQCLRVIDESFKKLMERSCEVFHLYRLEDFTGWILPDELFGAALNVYAEKTALGKTHCRVVHYCGTGRELNMELHGSISPEIRKIPEVMAKVLELMLPFMIHHAHSPGDGSLKINPRAGGVEIIFDSDGNALFSNEDDFFRKFMEGGAGEPHYLSGFMAAVKIIFSLLGGSVYLKTDDGKTVLHILNLNTG